MADDVRVLPFRLFEWFALNPRTFTIEFFMNVPVYGRVKKKNFDQVTLLWPKTTKCEPKTHRMRGRKTQNFRPNYLGRTETCAAFFRPYLLSTRDFSLSRVPGRTWIDDLNSLSCWSCSAFEMQNCELLYMRYRMRVAFVRNWTQQST